MKTEPGLYYHNKTRNLVEVINVNGTTVTFVEMGSNQEIYAGVAEFQSKYTECEHRQEKVVEPTHYPEGRKLDAGKLQYGLLPVEALKDTVDVLTFGAAKYAPNNWKYVEDAQTRYFDAAQRHLWAYKAGEVNDPESGKPHLAHAICCLMFILDLDKANGTH